MSYLFYLLKKAIDASYFYKIIGCNYNNVDIIMTIYDMKYKESN